MGHRAKTGACLVETLDFDLFWTPLINSLVSKIYMPYIWRLEVSVSIWLVLKLVSSNRFVLHGLHKTPYKKKMLSASPRIIISALKGGSGKTIISLGLAAAWRKKGYKVAPFKKGPDFIDAGWLSFAAARACHNLDPFLMTSQQILGSFGSNSTDSDIALIEGNRGLFDGLDAEGCFSTAELGKILKSPVIIIVDVTMVTRTVAALILGCQKFEPDLKICAVIINRVGGTRQESVVKNAIEQYCGIPVIGSVPKLKENIFPERHMGLVPHLETVYARSAIEWARAVVEKNLDIQAVWKLANDAEPLERHIQRDNNGDTHVFSSDPPRIGVIKDNAFWFYYPENLDQLETMGAFMVEVNALADKELPELDALYIGGGFPETQAEALADNTSFRESLKRGIDAGLPVYAECGGLMYLGESLVVNEKTYPMAGILPVKFVLEEKPQGHGYTILEVTRQNPYYPVGEALKGHEFHYSRPVISMPEEINPVFEVRRGRGLDGQRDGLCKKNLLATYTHLHAGGNPLWGRRFFMAAVEAKNLKKKDFSNHREKRD
jgi:cobyrinic acid a,c-diamide synthase